MISSRLSAFVILYNPGSVVSSNDVPDEKKREEASDVLDEIYLRLISLRIKPEFRVLTVLQR